MSGDATGPADTATPLTTTDQQQNPTRSGEPNTGDVTVTEQSMRLATAALAEQLRVPVGAESLPGIMVPEMAFTESGAPPLWRSAPLKITQFVLTSDSSTIEGDATLGASSTKAYQYAHSREVIHGYPEPAVPGVDSVFGDGNTARSYARSVIMRVVFAAIAIARSTFYLALSPGSYINTAVQMLNPRVAHLVSRKRLGGNTNPHPVMAILYMTSNAISEFDAVLGAGNYVLGIDPQSERTNGGRAYFAVSQEVVHPFEASGLIAGEAYYTANRLTFDRFSKIMTALLPSDFYVCEKAGIDQESMFFRILPALSDHAIKGSTLLMASTMRHKESMCALLLPMLDVCSISESSELTDSLARSSELAPVSAGLAKFANAYNPELLKLILFSALAPNQMRCEPVYGNTASYHINLQTFMLLVNDILTLILFPIPAWNAMAYVIIPRMFMILKSVINKEMMAYLTTVGFARNRQSIRTYANCADFYDDLPKFCTDVIGAQYPALRALQRILRPRGVILALDAKDTAGFPNVTGTAWVSSEYISIASPNGGTLSLTLDQAFNWLSENVGSFGQRVSISGLSQQERTSMNAFLNALTSRTEYFSRMWHHSVGMAHQLIANSPWTAFTPTAPWNPDGRYIMPLRIIRDNGRRDTISNILNLVVPDGFGIMTFLKFETAGHSAMQSAGTTARVNYPDYESMAKKLLSLWTETETTLAQAYELNTIIKVSSGHFLDNLQPVQGSQDWLALNRDDIFTPVGLGPNYAQVPVREFQGNSVLQSGAWIGEPGGSARFLSQPSQVAKLVDLLQGITKTSLPDIVTRSDGQLTAAVLSQPEVVMINKDMNPIGVGTGPLELVNSTYAVHLTRVLSAKLHPDNYNSNMTMGVIVSPRHVKRVDPFQTDLSNEIDVVEYIENGQISFGDGTVWPATPALRYLLVNSRNEIDDYVSQNFNLDGFAMVAYGGVNPVFTLATADQNGVQDLYLCDVNSDPTVVTNWLAYTRSEYVILIAASSTIPQMPMNSQLFKRIMDQGASEDEYPGQLSIYDPYKMVMIEKWTDIPTDDSPDVYFQNTPGMMSYALQSDTFAPRVFEDLTQKYYKSLYTFPSQTWLSKFAARNLNIPNSLMADGTSRVMIRKNKVFPTPTDIDIRDALAPSLVIQDAFDTNFTRSVFPLPVYDDASTVKGWPPGALEIAAPLWANRTV